MPNTKLIATTKTKSLPDFQPTKRTTRVVTKHFTNLAFYLPQDQYCLLSWLVYNCEMDNTIKYSTFILRRYSEAIKAVCEHYKADIGVKTSLQTVRLVFKSLIEQGYIISFNNKLLLNPMLSYQADYISSKKYHEICKKYAEGKDVCEDFIATINRFKK